MKDTDRIFAYSSIAWAFFTLCGIILMILIAPFRNYNVYDIQGGMRALNEQPLLVIGGQIVFAWAGVALVFMVLAFNDVQPAAPRAFIQGAATTFGLISSAFFLLFGLVGGFASYELTYIQSSHSAAYVQEAYLPIMLIMNRLQAAAISASGLWFALANWLTLRNRAFSQWVAYIGLSAGMIALPGFVIPGGGFSLLSLLLSVIWGVLAGFQGLRRSTVVVPIPD